jgi:hypothetical protein
VRRRGGLKRTIGTRAPMTIPQVNAGASILPPTSVSSRLPSIEALGRGAVNKLFRSAAQWRGVRRFATFKVISLVTSLDKRRSPRRLPHHAANAWVLRD